MEYTQWAGPHWHGFWGMPFIFMILIFFFVIFMARRAGGWRDVCGCSGRGRLGWGKPGQHSLAQRWSETPGQILDRRYASGEITKEQHEQMKRHIESSRQPTGAGAE